MYNPLSQKNYINNKTKNASNNYCNSVFLNLFTKNLRLFYDLSTVTLVTYTGYYFYNKFFKREYFNIKISGTEYNQKKY